MATNPNWVKQFQNQQQQRKYSATYWSNIQVGNIDVGNMGPPLEYQPSRFATDHVHTMTKSTPLYQSSNGAMLTFDNSTTFHSEGKSSGVGLGISLPI